jgi:signal transduction histidine kinase
MPMTATLARPAPAGTTPARAPARPARQSYDGDVPAHVPPVDTVVAAPDETARPAPWVADVVLALATTSALALVTVATDDDAGPPDVVDYLVAVGFGALLLLRRRAPVPVLLLATAASLATAAAGFPWGVALPVLAALGSAAAQGRTRWAIGGGAVVVVAGAGLRGIRDGATPAAIVDGVVTDGALVVAAVALGVVVRLTARDRERASLAGAAAAAATTAEAAAEHAAHDRRQAELLRLAGDLHDVVAHNLSVVSLHSGVATEAVGRDDDAARTALRHVREATSATVHELRAAVQVMRRDVATPSGARGGARAATPDGVPSDRPVRDTLPAVTGPVGLSLLVEPARSAGGDVNTWVDAPTGSIDAIVDAAAYRIVQEALANVLRHARAGHAVVRLVVADGRLRVSVSDDGRGAPLGTPAGAGIAAMRERAALLGGTLVARPRDDGGFGVVADLPTRLVESREADVARRLPS